MTDDRTPREKLGAFVGKILNDDVYQHNLRIAMQDRSIHPHVERAIWFYAIGQREALLAEVIRQYEANNKEKKS